MIDIDELERRAVVCAESKIKICVVNSESLLEVIGYLRQSEKDAARYRWLRDDAYNYLSGPMIFNCDYCGNPKPDDDGDVIAMVGSEVDLSVDEAMKCSK